MPREMSRPVFFKAENFKAGDKFIEKGEFIGLVDGRFGPQLKFKELDSGTSKVVGGGLLKWMVAEDEIIKGGVYDVIYGGKKILEKGDYKGKETNEFTTAEYDSDEYDASKLVYKGGAPEPVVPAALAAETATLDDLD